MNLRLKLEKVLKSQRVNIHLSNVITKEISEKKELANDQIKSHPGLQSSVASENKKAPTIWIVSALL